MRAPGTPAARARRYSPPETTSMPAPSEAISADDREVGVGLHRVADQVRQPGERLLEHAVVPGQGRGGIDVDRRADRRGDLGERDVLDVERAVAVEEMVHLSPAPRAGAAARRDRPRSSDGAGHVAAGPSVRIAET